MQAKQTRSDILYMTTLDTGRCSHKLSGVGNKLLGGGSRRGRNTAFAGVDTRCGDQTRRGCEGAQENRVGEERLWG